MTTFGTITGLYELPRRRKSIKRLRWMLVRLDVVAEKLEAELGNDSDEPRLLAVYSERSAVLWTLDVLDPVIRACPKCGACNEVAAFKDCIPEDGGCPMAGPGTWEESLIDLNKQYRGEGAPMVDAEDLMIQHRERRRERRRAAATSTTEDPQ